MTQQLPLSPIRSAIVAKARSYAGKIGGLPGSVQGVDHMMTMYRETVSGPSSLLTALSNPTVFDQMREGRKQGLWISKQRRPEKPGYYRFKGDISEQSKGISWCGIFAAWVLKQAGMNVSWLARGDCGFQLDARKIERNLLGTGANPARDKIQAGDVCVLNTAGNNRYHVIIVDASPGRDPVSVVEGNIAAALRHVVRESAHFRKSQFHTWYRINDDDWHQRFFAVGGRWAHRHL